METKPPLTVSTRLKHGLNGNFLIFVKIILAFFFLKARKLKLHLNERRKDMDKKNKNKRGSQKDVMAKPLEIVSMKETQTDPNGSWTGVPQNPFDKPVQDADDL